MSALVISHLLAELRDRLPDALAAVFNGEITLREARELLDETSDHSLEVLRASYVACRTAMLSRDPNLLKNFPTTVEALEDEVTRHPLAGTYFLDGTITFLQMRYATAFGLDPDAIDRCIDRSDTRRAKFFREYERRALLARLPEATHAAFAATSTECLRFVVHGRPPTPA